MVNAVASIVADDLAPSRARAGDHLRLLVSLLSPGLLLGVLHTWSLATAPRYGVYFTAEAVLALYALLAVVRGVQVSVHSHDDQGRYDAAKARQARLAFYSELRA